MKDNEVMDGISRILKLGANLALPSFIQRSSVRKFLRRNQGKALEVPTREGCRLRVVIGDNVDNEIALTGRFEPHISALIQNIVTGANGSFLDVGCHLGYYSTMVSTVSPGIHVTAVDANPIMAGRCRDNLERNGFVGGVINVGVGAERTVLNFHTSRRSPSLGTFGENPLEDSEVETIQVQVIPFSEIVDRVEGAISLMKMDVEGFEYLALSTLRTDQVKRIENMIIEFSEIRLKQCGQSRAAFQSLPWLSDYNLKLISENGELKSLNSLAEVPGGDQNIWLGRKKA